MLEGKTSRGFEYSIEEDVLNDWEILESLADLENNVLLVVRVAKKVLGKNYEKLKEFCRNEKGTVQTDMLQDTLLEIFSNHQEIKN